MPFPITRIAVLAALIVAVPVAGVSARGAKGGSDALGALDPDRDGTVDLNEAKSAASAVFDRRERDNDGTLDAKELQGRLSRVDLRRADPDNDGTLTKDEYLALVEERFKAANPDRDGTLDRKELASPAGRTLMRLLK